MGMKPLARLEFSNIAPEPHVFCHGAVNGFHFKGQMPVLRIFEIGQ